MNSLACNQITVCMIVYNEETLIKQCLKSLTDNGFDDFVILDMFSTDGTKSCIVETLARRVRFVDYPRRSLLLYGYGQARDVCASFAQREWVLFIDADEVLTAGVDCSKIDISSALGNASVYSIARNNLAASDAGNYIYLKEVHNRIYKPSPRHHWVGYIHEEIYVDNNVLEFSGGQSSLVIDHYSALKPASDSASKSGMYAVMLLRLYHYSEWRFGTNQWWYNHYIPENLITLQHQAEQYATINKLDHSFYDPKAVKMGVNVPSTIFHNCFQAAQDEVVMPTGVMRNLHAMQISKWTGTNDLAFWAEWNHPAEGSRSLQGIVDGLQTCNWHKYINAGTVCIDIGGHSGDTAIPMALFAYDSDAKRKTSVILVEPNPALLPLLEINMSLNSHLGNFHLVNAAITDLDVAEIELADHGNGQCNGGVLDPKASREVSERLQQVAQHRYTARGVSMSTLFAEIKKHVTQEPVGFIKIDCEGFDKEIIKPCKDLFSEYKPVLYIEWFAWFTQEDDQDLFDAIASIDYVPLDPITLDKARVDHRIGDLLCIHRSKT